MHDLPGRGRVWTRDRTKTTYLIPGVQGLTAHFNGFYLFQVFYRFNGFTSF